MAQIIQDNKKTWEVFAVLMGFGNNMDGDETIDLSKSSVTIYTINDGQIADDVTELLLSGDPYLQNEQMIGIVLSGGTNYQKYKIKFKAYISETKKLEEHLIFHVLD